MTNTLKVLKPVTVTDAVLTSTTVAEADHAAWSSGTTYVVGDRVIVVATHRIYESQLVSNLNNDPTDILNRTGLTIWWIDVSATNAWKMFDNQVSSPTVEALTLTVVLLPSKFFRSLSLFGVQADTVTVTQKDAPGGSTVFSETFTMEDSQTNSYYDHWFSGFEIKTDLIIDSLLPFSTGELTVTLTAGVTVKCGTLHVGTFKLLGMSLTDVIVEPRTYSSIRIDEFGENKIIRRKSAKDITNVSALVEEENANNVLRVLTDVQDQSVPWVVASDQNYQGLRTVGIGNGRLIYDNPNQFTLRANIKGLI